MGKRDFLSKVLAYNLIVDDLLKNDQLDVKR